MATANSEPMTIDRLNPMNVSLSVTLAFSQSWSRNVHPCSKMRVGDGRVEGLTSFAPTYHCQMTSSANTTSRGGVSSLTVRQSQFENRSAAPR